MTNPSDPFKDFPSFGDFPSSDFPKGMKTATGCIAGATALYVGLILAALAALVVILFRLAF